MLDALSSADKICVVKRNDMVHAMLEYAVIVAIKVVEKFGPETEEYCAMARCIKEEFNAKFGPTWHCLLLIRGGSSLTHQARGYICLEYGPFLITLFKQ